MKFYYYCFLFANDRSELHRKERWLLLPFWFFREALRYSLAVVRMPRQEETPWTLNSNAKFIRSGKSSENNEKSFIYIIQVYNFWKPFRNNFLCLLEWSFSIFKCPSPMSCRSLFFLQFFWFYYGYCFKVITTFAPNERGENFSFVELSFSFYFIFTCISIVLFLMLL